MSSIWDFAIHEVPISEDFPIDKMDKHLSCHFLQRKELPLKPIYLVDWKVFAVLNVFHEIQMFIRNKSFIQLKYLLAEPITFFQFFGSFWVFSR